MLQTCFGIYSILALFAFLFVWGAMVKTKRYDEEY